jgi:hypothetical protein
MIERFRASCNTNLQSLSLVSFSSTASATLHQLNFYPKQHQFYSFSEKSSRIFMGVTQKPSKISTFINKAYHSFLA